MAFDVINTGTTANDGTGDPLRTAFTKVNDNTAKAVEGPASSTNNSVAVYDGTTGKLLKDGTGTVTAGKFSPTANTVAGNGVYLPATNAVAISTDGVERLRVLATGNVGIGTATPARLLDVATDAAIHGVRVGRGAGDISSNTAVGSGALNVNTTGSTNTAVGLNSILANTTGASNTALGESALRSNTTANQNTAVGRDSVFTNTTGANNTGVGYRTLLLNTTGSDNTAAGGQALDSNTTGVSNAALGRFALSNNTTGNLSAAFGAESLQRFRSAGAQTAVGYRALRGGSATATDNTGSENTAVGYQAGDGITTGSTNTIVGHNAGRSITTGSGNTVLGAGLAGSAALANTVLIGAGGTERFRITDSGAAIVGNGDGSSTPAAAVFRGTDASGTDVTGASMTIRSGRGTGSSGGGSISLQTSAPGTSGSTLNAATARLFINAAGNVGVNTTSPQTVLNVNGTFQVGTGIASNLPSNFSVFTQRTKTSIAPAGTAVLDIQAGTSIAIVAQVVIDVYLAENAGLQGHFKYDYLTITPNGTVGGTATITTMYDGSTGNFVVAGGDFVVTRPSAGLIRITYTNGNGSGNNNIGFLVSGYGIATATVT
jgi:hypothetical protein